MYKMAQNATKIRIASINARGCNSAKKKATLSQWMLTNNFDILCIQETHLKEEKIKDFDTKWQGTCYHNPSTSNHSKGVVTIFKNTQTLDIGSIHKHGDGRIILTNFSKFDRDFSLVNLYAPTETQYKKQFFEEAYSFIMKNRKQTSKLIVAGDININIDINKNKDACFLKNLMDRLNLKDKFTPKNNRDKGYTFFNNRYKS